MSVSFDLLPTNFQLVLSAPLREATGLALARTHDVARPHHPVTLRGATIAWGQVALSNLTYIDLTPAAPDYLDVAAADALDLDFGNAPSLDPFSLALWVNADLLIGAIRTLMCHGQTGAAGAGWQWNLGADGILHLITEQAGALQTTDALAAGAISINRWWFLVATCDGNYPTAAVKLLKNAVDVTEAVPGVHITPDTAVANNLYIGVHDNAAGGVELPFSGLMWNPRIWERQLSSIEIWNLFEMERKLFGV